MRLWQPERVPGTLSRSRAGFSVNLLGDKPLRPRCLRDARRSATWREWCARGLRREALPARALAAPWQPEAADAIRKLVDGSSIGQHVLAAVA
eukprot:13512590-Alexandrium_andersonii.AAC.1